MSALWPPAALLMGAQAPLGHRGHGGYGRQGGTGLHAACRAFLLAARPEISSPAISAAMDELLQLHTTASKPEWHGQAVIPAVGAPPRGHLRRQAGRSVHALIMVCHHVG